MCVLLDIFVREKNKELFRCFKDIDPIRINRKELFRLQEKKYRIQLRCVVLYLVKEMHSCRLKA
jgi:hypothetical protein